MSKLAPVLFLSLGLSVQCAASTFFFPGTTPRYVTGEAPRWLHEGHGKDGYLTITSEVIPASSCVPLSNHTFWGGEKTQLVLSVTTNGFKKNLDNSEIPIATFDGRDNGSECASLSTLPINVVPLALLGSFSSYNPGMLSLVVNVKSSNDSNQDFIGSAKLLLGAAAMVVTGGTASAISGITATVSNPLLSEAQSRTNNLMQGMVNAKTRISLSWPQLRNGIRTIGIPVYRADGSTEDTNISQTENKADKTVLFTVRLTFSYSNSLFEPATAETPLNPDNSAAVLNYQMANSPYNFLQLLNDSSPSLLQAIELAEGHDLTNDCSIGFDKLKKIGLSNIDMAMVMKSFIDESRRGAGWYSNPALVKSCFSQESGMQAILEKIYGPSSPKFVVGDVQDGFGKDYRDWREAVGPVLSDFRKALIAKEDRANVLANFNGKRDIRVTFSPEVQTWQMPADADPSMSNRFPGIEKLAGKNIRTMGCFIYKDAENLNPRSSGAYFVMEDMEENFWLDNARLSTSGSGKIASLNIAELTADWQKYFASYSYPGGDCAGILARFKRKDLENLSRLANSKPDAHEIPNQEIPAKPTGAVLPAAP